MAKSKTRPQTETNEVKTEEKVNETKTTSKNKTTKTEFTKEQLEEAMKACNIETKYAHSEVIKFAAMTRKMSCEQIYGEFVRNPRSFIAITNSKEFKSIKDLIKNPNVTYRGNPISDKLKDAFILWLTKNTNYANERLKKNV